MQAFLDHSSSANSHLAVAGTTVPEITGELSRLVDTYEELGERAEKHRELVPIVRHIASFVLAYLRRKPMSSLEEKSHVVEILEVVTKLLPHTELPRLLRPARALLLGDRSCPAWRRIDVVRHPPAEVQGEYDFVKAVLDLTAAASVEEAQQDCLLSRTLCFNCAFPRYFVDQAQGRLVAMRLLRKPTLPLLQSMWNIPEKGAIRHVSTVFLPGVATNAMVYLPPALQPNSDIFVPTSHSVPVRVLSSRPLPLKPARQPPSTDVLLHMHGGGFIALSSHSMQNCTRKWAIDLGVPVFSVDYRTPPESPFPTAPYDCLRVYEFLLSHC